MTFLNTFVLYAILLFAKNINALRAPFASHSLSKTSHYGCLGEILGVLYLMMSIKHSLFRERTVMAKRDYPGN